MRQGERGRERTRYTHTIYRDTEKDRESLAVTEPEVNQETQTQEKETRLDRDTHTHIAYQRHIQSERARNRKRHSQNKNPKNETYSTHTHIHTLTHREHGTYVDRADRTNSSQQRANRGMDSYGHEREAGRRTGEGKTIIAPPSSWEAVLSPPFSR